MLDAAHGWLVGESGLIMQWDGRDWTRVGSPVTVTLTAVDIVDEENAWAVGRDDILRWDGTLWQIAPHPAADPNWRFYFNDVAMISGDEGWVVGSGGILHWQGTEWSVPEGPQGFDLISVIVADRDDVWAVGKSGHVMHWNGAMWTLGESAIHDRDMYGLDIVGTSSLIAVGERGVIFTRSLADRDAIHEGWAEVSDTMSARIAKRMDFIESGEGWFVGDGHYRAVRLVDSTWTTFLLPTSQVSDIDMTSARDGWIVGKELTRWNGVAWTTHPTVLESRALSVSMLDANSGWVVGATGMILRWDGSSWSNSVSPVTSTLTSVSVPDASSAWAVGNDYDSQGRAVRSVVLRWSGSAWTQEADYGGIELYDVVMRTRDSGWIVGDGVILRWDGRSWSTQATPSGVTLYAAAFSSEVSGWAVGCNSQEDEGIMLKWDGATWTSFESPVGGCPISDVAMTPQGSAWAVGARNDTFLRFDTLPPTSLYLPVLWR